MTIATGKARVGSSPPKQFLDAELVQECLQGKEAAWSVLIAKYKNLIYSIPVRYGFSEEDSADIFQAVCMDLLTELPTLRQPNALAGWLIQVTRNKCFHRKKAQLHSKVQEIDDLSSLAAPHEPEALAVRVQQEQVLREAVTCLSPRCQRLVHMLFFELPARPYEQVARDLELAQGSIGFIRRRCLDKLKDRLEELGYRLL
jgi:RNA polymerase sigma factor (sigma-70 family)